MRSKAPGRPLETGGHEVGVAERLERSRRPDWTDQPTHQPHGRPACARPLASSPRPVVRGIVHAIDGAMASRAGYTPRHGLRPAHRRKGYMSTRAGILPPAGDKLPSARAGARSPRLRRAHRDAHLPARPSPGQSDLRNLASTTTASSRSGTSPGWPARSSSDPLHVFDANIFYPHRWTLAYSEANLGAGALAAPVYWLDRERLRRAQLRRAALLRAERRPAPTTWLKYLVRRSPRGVRRRRLPSPTARTCSRTSPTFSS